MFHRGWFVSDQPSFTWNRWYEDLEVIDAAGGISQVHLSSTTCNQWMWWGYGVISIRGHQIRNHASCLSNPTWDFQFSKSRKVIFFNLWSKPHFIETYKLSEAEILSRKGPACLTFAIRDQEVSTDRKNVQTGHRTILALVNPHTLCLNRMFLYCKLILIAKHMRTGLECINSWVLCISYSSLSWNFIFILCRIMTRGIGMNSIDQTGFLSVTFNLPQVLDAST